MKRGCFITHSQFPIPHCPLKVFDRIGLSICVHKPVKVLGDRLAISVFACTVFPTVHHTRGITEMLTKILVWQGLEATRDSKKVGCFASFQL